jgi:hypothetical protein
MSVREPLLTRNLHPFCRVDAGKISWQIIVSHTVGDGFALADIETEFPRPESKGVGGPKAVQIR